MGAGLRSLAVVVIALLLSGLAAGDGKDRTEKVDPETLREVREILRASNYGDWIQVLIEMGSAANGAYLMILQDQAAMPLEVNRIFNRVADQAGDRSAFLPFAMKMVDHKDGGVRQSAAALLGEIGSAKQTHLLAPLLSDPKAAVQFHAAGALAKIGTAKEVEAFDRRLATKHTQDFPEKEVVGELRRCRDRLKARLEAEKKK